MQDDTAPAHHGADPLGHCHVYDRNDRDAIPAWDAVRTARIAREVGVSQGTGRGVLPGTDATGSNRATVITGTRAAAR